jgi:hypothetical protein
MAGSEGQPSKPSIRPSIGKDPEFRLEQTPYERRIPACAECRRLKRKCDRKWPCQSCVQRGCASICPTGSLAAEAGGSRMILRTLKDMSKRIGQLEDALTSAWNHKEDHPLLKPDLLRIKNVPETPVEENEESSEKVAQESEDVRAILSHGESFARRQRNLTSYYGPAVSSEVSSFCLMQCVNCCSCMQHLSHRSGSATRSGPNQPLVTTQDVVPLPSTILELSNFSSLTSVVHTTITPQDLHTYLPPLPHAIHLCDCFYQYCSWLYSPMSRDEFISDIVSFLYRTSGAGPSDRSVSPESTSRNMAHTLALIFTVMSLGAQFDTSDSASPASSETYHTLSRAALSLEPLVNGASMELIYALTLLTHRYIDCPID